MGSERTTAEEIILARTEGSEEYAAYRKISPDSLIGGDFIRPRVELRRSVRYMHAHRLSRSQIQRLVPETRYLMAHELIRHLTAAFDLGLGYKEPHPLPSRTGFDGDDDVCEKLTDMIIDLSTGMDAETQARIESEMVA